MQLSVLRWSCQQQQNSIRSSEVRLMLRSEDSTSRAEREPGNEWHDTCAVLIKAGVATIVAAVMPAAPGKQCEWHRSRMPGQAWIHTFKLMLHYTFEHTLSNHRYTLLFSSYQSEFWWWLSTRPPPQKWLLPLITSKTQEPHKHAR